nr:reverse transcriptase domain-containing protein [Tanacetum cinerariifolium]
MTLELATRSIAYPAGIAKDVFVQVGKFTFPVDFIVVDYDVDPRVPLILGRPFLRTARALVDVHEEELILRDGDEKLIFHADSTPKHPHKHGNESINMINFIDITCEDHFPKWANLSTYPLKRFNSFFYDDDDEDYTIAVTPILSTEEPDNSLSLGDEHLDTIPVTESDEFNKSSVENLISIPSESERIPDNMCDVPFHDNSLPLDVSEDQFEDFSDSNDEFSSTDDDFFSIDNIDYVEASPPDSEIVISEAMEIVIPDQYLDELKRLSNLEYRDEIKIAEPTENFNVIPVLSTEEPDNSLSMGDEHLDTIPATESDEVIMSSVENLILIP